MSKRARRIALQVFSSRRRATLLLAGLLAPLLVPLLVLLIGGLLAAGAAIAPARPALAQEATRIPVFPTLPRTTTATATATTITATPVVSPTAAATATPAPTMALFVPAVPGPSESGVLFLPLVSSQRETPTATAVVPALPTLARVVQSIAGLLGVLERDASGDERLVIAGGTSYALVPATTELDARLMLLTLSGPLEVRASGTLYSSGNQDANAFLVVTALVDAHEAETPVPSATPAPSATPVSAPTATLQPTATPTPGRPPAAVGRFDAVNLRTGPGESYARSGQILRDQRCPLRARNASGAWVELDCQGAIGWVEARLITLDGDAMAVPEVAVDAPTATATPTPSPTPTATPYTFLGWRTLYFANTSLDGVPAAVDDLPVLDLNWGTGPARAGLPADAFSVRFERTIDFAPGFYFFRAEADDGIRIYIDGQPMIDALSGAGGLVYRFGSELSGLHTVRVEYVELSGAASVRLAWTQAAATRWNAAYSGLPVVAGGLLARMEPDGGDTQLDYLWGNGSPTGPYAGSWMARWDATYSFSGGDYLFWAQADDGVRLYLDDLLVLDKWTDGVGEVRNRFLNLGGGEHRVRVEYYQRTGIARLRVWWARETGGNIEPR